MMWTTLAPWALKWARRTWPLWAALALVVAVVASIRAYGQARFDAGVASVVAVPLPSAPVRAAEDTARAKTDTVWLRAKATSRQAERAIAALPDSVAALPAVDTLVQVVTTLTAQVDTLGHALSHERAMARLRAASDSATIVQQRVVIAVQERTIAALEKRPTRLMAGVGALLAAAAAFSVGVMR